MNKYIFIATKGRPNNCTTMEKLLEENCSRVVLVVEPQDFDSYEKVFGSSRLMRLPKDNQGVTFARNFILAKASEMGCDWFWMMDDDIKSMHITENSKIVKKSFLEVIARAESVITETHGVALGAMEYGQYAWSAKKERVFNSYCDVAVLINVEKTRHLLYRDNCKEDRDFVLQCLASGYDVVRSSMTSFSCPKNGSNKGGLHDAYAKGLENHWSKRMIDLWPGICEMKIKKDGRPDVKIHWKKVKLRGV